MSTNAFIALKTPHSPEYRAVYLHWDGYPEYAGEILNKHYTEYDKARQLLNLGAISVLEANVSPEEGVEHSFEKPADGVTIAYHRDRGENLRINLFNTVEEVIEYGKSFAEYIYIAEPETTEETLNWYCFDTACS